MKCEIAPKKISLDLSVAKELIKMQYRDQAAVSASLKHLLLKSQKEGRLTCGIYNCGTLLSKNPDNVMLCILREDSSNDVALNIHFTLIEAFCWENDIPVIKVDSAENLSKLLNANEKDALDIQTKWSEIDCSCLLVEYPYGECTSAEENVLLFYKMSCNTVPQLVLELEV